MRSAGILLWAATSILMAGLVGCGAAKEQARTASVPPAAAPAGGSTAAAGGALSPTAPAADTPLSATDTERSALAQQGVGLETQQYTEPSEKAPSAAMPTTEDAVAGGAASSNTGSPGRAPAFNGVFNTFDANETAPPHLFQQGAAPPPGASAPQPPPARFATPYIGTYKKHVARAGAVPAPAPVYDANMYLSSTYQGGAGERDRVEKLIQEGFLVEGKRVRLDAFPRTYAQTFAIPTQTALAVYAEPERSKVVEQGGKTYLQVAIQARKGEAPRRPPLNVALVLDLSGSMQAEQKLDYARKAAVELVARLGPQDLFSLVTFDSAAVLRFPAGPVQNRARMQRLIRGLDAGSGTNIYDGLQLGYREVRKHSKRDGVNLVLLLSDGEVNEGVTDPAQFEKLTAQHADAEIQTSAVGLGMSFNEELMSRVARSGQGNYHFIKQSQDTVAVFRRELDDLTQVVARAVRVRIHLADGVGFLRALGSSRLGAREVQAVKEQEKKVDRRVYEELGIGADRQRQPEEPGIKVVIPNFYLGDSHVVMLEIQVPPGRGRRKLADVSIKYKDLARRTNAKAETSAAIHYVPDQASMVASVNRNVKKNLLGFQTGEALLQAADHMAAGRPAAAVRCVDDRMVVLGVAAREWSDRDLDRDGRLLDRYKTVLQQVAKNPQLVEAGLGDYLRKSLAYNGYQMTR